MQQAVTRYQQPAGDPPDLFRLGKVLATSGYFKDAKDEAQAVVKVLAGQEIGIGPVAAMVGIHVVDGKPTFSARLMASLVKRSGRYTYRVTTMSEQECTIEFYEDKELAGVSTFTMKDAETAGLKGKPVWKAYPRNMLFARAMSNGFNWYTPDLSNGLPVYTPEELGTEVDAEGEIVSPARVIAMNVLDETIAEARTEHFRDEHSQLTDPDDLPFDDGTDIATHIAKPKRTVSSGDLNRVIADGLTWAIKAGVGQKGYQARISKVYGADGPGALSLEGAAETSAFFRNLAQSRE